jgi:hypothetical protein
VGTARWICEFRDVDIRRRKREERSIDEGEVWVTRVTYL